MLFADFMADDLIQLGVLEKVTPAAAWTGPWDLYTISDGIPAHILAMQNAGLFPWAAEPAFEMSFFRPLSSGLLALDHALFGLHPIGYRLHGALWSLALVAAVGWVFRRVLLDRIAKLALIVFVLSAIHGIFCWTAARHVVVAAALGFAALAAHIRWREEGWRPGAGLALVALALSLAASEAGIAMAAYVLAYEALGAAGPLRARLTAAAPAWSWSLPTSSSGCTALSIACCTACRCRRRGESFPGRPLRIASSAPLPTPWRWKSMLAPSAAHRLSPVRLSACARWK
jgi:hypothetical protein